jgi:hypothetical protein
MLNTQSPFCFSSTLPRIHELVSQYPIREQVASLSVGRYFEAFLRNHVGYHLYASLFLLFLRLSRALSAAFLVFGLYLTFVLSVAAKLGVMDEPIIFIREKINSDLRNSYKRSE